MLRSLLVVASVSTKNGCRLGSVADPNRHHEKMEKRSRGVVLVEGKARVAWRATKNAALREAMKLYNVELQRVP